jgi:hypothetical protein
VQSPAARGGETELSPERTGAFSHASPIPGEKRQLLARK